MKNPFYPTIVIDKDTIRNYNKCLIVTRKSINTTVVDSSIFDEEINKNTFY